MKNEGIVTKNKPPLARVYLFGAFLQKESLMVWLGNGMVWYDI